MKSFSQSIIQFFASVAPSLVLPSPLQSFVAFISFRSSVLFDSIVEFIFEWWTASKPFRNFSQPFFSLCAKLKISTKLNPWRNQIKTLYQSHIWPNDLPITKRKKKPFRYIVWNPFGPCTQYTKIVQFIVLFETVFEINIGFHANIYHFNFNRFYDIFWNCGIHR